MCGFAKHCLCFCALVLISQFALAADAPAFNSLGITMVSISAGSFEMGVDTLPLPAGIIKGTSGVSFDRPTLDGDYDEVPVHKVTITKPFRMSQTEVTAEQFRAFKPEYAGDEYWALYANGVSWNDAAAFCEWLSKKEGKAYRLPTEAEWEFVCRAGGRGLFTSGYAFPAPEASNKWGVKNLNTNLAEWCYDWHGIYPADPQTDPVGPASGLGRVVRGGGLDYNDSDKDEGKHLPAESQYYRRSANRASAAPDFASPLGNIGFRVVEADLPKTTPLPVEPRFFQVGIKQNKPNLSAGPEMSKPYYRTRELFPDLGERNMREVGWKIGLARGLGSRYHNSAIQMCDNGDLVAAYYNTLEWENDNDQTILTMRLRYGAEDWDMPEPWPDFADAADAAPVFWNDHGKLWLFFGSRYLLGGPPFQFMTSSDNGATWSDVHTPVMLGKVGGFTPQPVSSFVRDREGTLYLPVDGEGANTALFASKDEGKTWYDTGDRTAARHTTFVLGKDGSIIGFGGKSSDINGFMPKSVSTDGGKSYVKTATTFRPLNSGQRPSVVRLASGRLFMVGDSYPSKPPPRRPGAWVALSDDDGLTWKTRDLPGKIATVGYVTATQTPNGVIHIVTSKTDPAIHIEMNEAWVLNGGAETPPDASIHDVGTSREVDASDRARLEYGGGIAADGNYRLHGKQIVYFETGEKQWEVEYNAGRKVGVETYWSRPGVKAWERMYNPDGAWTWRVFDSAGKETAESKWQGKTLLEARAAL